MFILPTMRGMISGVKGARYIGGEAQFSTDLYFTDTTVRNKGGRVGDTLLMMSPNTATPSSSAGNAWEKKSYTTTLSPHTITVCWKVLSDADMGSNTHILDGVNGPNIWALYRGVAGGIGPLQGANSAGPNLSLINSPASANRVGVIHFVADRSSVATAVPPTDYRLRNSYAEPPFAAQLADNLGFSPPSEHETVWSGFEATSPQGGVSFELLKDDLLTIPPMTSNTYGGLVTVASAITNPFYVFDGVPTTRWNGTANGNITVSFANPRTYSTYNVQTYSSSTLTGNWTLQGSYDGTTFVNLDSRGAEAFVNNVARTFTIATPGAYKHYRFQCGANSLYRINELSFA